MSLLVRKQISYLMRQNVISETPGLGTGGSVASGSRSSSLIESGNSVSNEKSSIEGSDA